MACMSVPTEIDIVTGIEVIDIEGLTIGIGNVGRSRSIARIVEVMTSGFGDVYAIRSA